jgi:adenylate cyclase
MEELETVGMQPTDPVDSADAEMWQQVLIEGHGPLRGTRRVFRYLPSPPRCKLCSSPFGGMGGRLAGLAGFKRSRKNPTLCTRCCDGMPRGGAEVDVAILFADVRGSTSLGRDTAASEFAELLGRFYAVATDTLIGHDAIVDKLIGDEVMALFLPGISGSAYRTRAVDAGLALLRAVGYGSGEEPWLNLGAGVNAGTAFVGNVGDAVVDFTALGDPVNVAARLQGQARPGELVVADGVEEEPRAGAERRIVEIRGHAQPMAVSVLGF